MKLALTVSFHLFFICNYLFADKVIDYETIAVKPGSYTLFVPVPAANKVEYVEKHIDLNQSFAIGKYEVSNQQWNQCYSMGVCKHPAKIEDGETELNPVARVTWHDAYQFSEWLSGISGKKYRLPTEEEWSYAVYQGKEHKELETEYDYSDAQKIKLIKKRTQPQGFYGENDWGVADYTGNVWEWTLSCWYASEENILKKRSISFLNSPEACFTRIALGENRSHIPDFIFDTYNGGCATLRPAANLGFRLVMEL